MSSSKQYTNLPPIDFNKPWWSLIIEQKWRFITILSIIAAAHTFWNLSPFWISKLFAQPSVTNCLILFTMWLIIDSSFRYATYLNASFQLSGTHRIYSSAHRYLLTIDPRYHIHRSSGALLGKIDRAARGYEILLDQITFEFIELLVGLVSMIIILASYSLLISLIICGCFALTTLIGYLLAKKIYRTSEQEFIESDDQFRSTAAENLYQIQLIRASFASDYMYEKLNTDIKKNMQVELGLWHSYNTAFLILNLLYLASVFFVLSMLAWRINQGIETLMSAMGLALSYINSTKDLVRIVKPLRQYMRGLTAVRDLFEFLPVFGKQHYPVLGPAKTSVSKDDQIELVASTISFDYETAKLFNNHSFQLQCNASNSNKLYGIIGPSGSGKTTLLSILGGQLKPITGFVLINQTDIYATNDATRRELIALQGQIAASMRGSVKYNLLFGLPADHGYSDQYLLTILDRVGLRAVLGAHKGLETMLGEGGLSLSGGQRQRLNFAGLYLRAQFYKPLVVLIDEPTSSLDEVSEAAITTMIGELAHHAITLVIAHRLKTVEDAVGLIDLSLINEEKKIHPHTAAELEKRSVYYKQLVQGIVALDA